ncbi:hypothetical protein ED28_08230 [[Pantoea] beijingensis]|uniref:Uncharacterized protein n=1 Tax=[Pantoea] beijingensis TaxID=1324864 RepID=A0A443IE81_9GAMM|nr:MULTISPECIES: hypothetical protein [Erwiniaceae]RWR02358.1 hypothetical protein ED28_08230 [[Pantoea] beijingensis]
MTKYHKVLVFFCGCIVLSTVLTGYYLWQYSSDREFSCQVNFVQHHSDETLNLWMHYNFNGSHGMLSMSGYAQSDPHKTFNRKISFRVTREGHVYSLHSELSIKFPDDHVSDEWLEKYEPLFFVYPDENLYIRIRKLQNGNYLFLFDSPPTYICSVPAIQEGGGVINFST